MGFLNKIKNKIKYNFYSPEYKRDSIIFNRVNDCITEYLDFLEKSKKTVTQTKLEKLGLTSSSNYNYRLTTSDENYYLLCNSYKKKYEGVIFITDNIIDRLGLDKIKKVNMSAIIPENIINFLVNFKIDTKDYRISEDDGGYNARTKDSDKSYDEVVQEIKKCWTSGSYYNEYLNKFVSGEHTYVGNSKYYTLNKDFFFLKYNNGGVYTENKKTFKEFIKKEDVTEYLVLQPVKGGYLLIGNW